MAVTKTCKECKRTHKTGKINPRLRSDSICHYCDPTIPEDQKRKQRAQRNAPSDFRDYVLLKNRM